MIPRAVRHVAVALGAVVIAACRISPAQERPAVLTNPSLGSRAELAGLVSAALNGAPVRLADDALTRDSALIVDREQPRDAAGLPLDGRTAGRPEHFFLLISGTACVLVHERTGKRQILRSATCQPTGGRGKRARRSRSFSS